MPKLTKLNNKGFAVSGVLYPILILTIFLIVEILTLMSTRKMVLDKNRSELLDRVNEQGRIYSNEELSVILDDLTAKKNDFLNKSYPVGSIYIGTTSTNPGSIFGGTWEAYGTGRTIVGVATGETEFNTVNKTGGAKEVAHGHGSGGKQNGSLAAAIGSTDNNIGAMGFKSANYFGGQGSSTYSLYGGFYNGGHFNHFTQVWGDTGSTSISVLQPYTTVYMWRRTA